MKKIASLPLCILTLLYCQSAGYLRSAGLTRLTIEHAGKTRYALVHVPAGSMASPCPLLLVLHGGGGTADGMVKLTKNRFNELADANGFFAVYPSGLSRGWNDFRNDPINYAHKENIDDVGFISALIDRLAADYPIDRNRVFATGISNGGFMSYRLACELSDKVRGIAAVAATAPVDQEGRCRPVRPVSVLIINGSDDPIVPYNGGEVTLMGNRGRIRSTEETLHYWTGFNKCPETAAAPELPDIDPDDGTRSRLTHYGPCAGGSGVSLIRVGHGGHTWPGGVQYASRLFIGRTSRDFNACDRIWDFFSHIR